MLGIGTKVYTINSYHPSVYFTTYKDPAGWTDLVELNYKSGSVAILEATICEWIVKAFVSPDNKTSQHISYKIKYLSGFTDIMVKDEELGFYRTDSGSWSKIYFDKTDAAKSLKDERKYILATDKLIKMKENLQEVINEIDEKIEEERKCYETI